MPLRLNILFLFLFLSGCATTRFALNDRSATEKLMATLYVAQLQKQNPSPIVCYVENSSSAECDLYLGEDHPDHAVRLHSCRVTADGRVWVNADETLLEDHWILIE